MITLESLLRKMFTFGGQHGHNTEIDIIGVVIKFTEQGQSQYFVLDFESEDTPNPNHPIKKEGKG